MTGPGQPDVCEAGNETYVPASAVIGNLPASDVTTQPRNHAAAKTTCSAKSTRAATLKALGLAKPTTAKAKTKTKSKGKGK